MRVKKTVFLLFLVIIFIASVHISEAFYAVGSGYNMTPVEKALQGGRSVTSGYNLTYIMGQLAIGKYSTGSYALRLGYLYRFNDMPTIDSIAINAIANSPSVQKHGYNNYTMSCEVNFTDLNAGDYMNLMVTWYRNNTAWYSDAYTINNNVNSYLTGSQYSGWKIDNTTYNVTATGTSMSFNTTAAGQIETSKLKHFDAWKCSAEAFDASDYSGWMNSTPFFIYNKAPDYRSSMPTYYEWPEDTSYQIRLGSNFSDIDSDDIDWYINYTSNITEPGTISRNNLTIAIDNNTGIATITPIANLAGMMYIIFAGTDKHNNDYGKTNAANFTLNISQVNDAPNATDAYIYPYNPTYLDTLSCEFTYVDIENYPENYTADIYKWYRSASGTEPFTVIPGETTKTLSSYYFGLNDQIICSAKVKDSYYYVTDRSLFDTQYRNSTARTIVQTSTEAQQSGRIIIAIG
jgi:hypothetical protein